MTIKRTKRRGWPLQAGVSRSGDGRSLKAQALAEERGNDLGTRMQPSFQVNKAREEAVERHERHERQNLANVANVGATQATKA
jgi:hypothetical protein